jgi:micrococcal nuclease
MTNSLYFYKATVNRVVDGDTLNLNIDLGFTIWWRSNCRLAGINAPELKAKEESIKVKANESKQYLVDCVKLGSEVLIKSRELDKYGRPVVDVYYGKDFEKHLNQELLEKGLAVVLK